MMKGVYLLFTVFFSTVFGELAADPPITDKVTFNIKQGDYDFGNLTLGLFGSAVPKTVENFIGLSNMTYGYGYEDTIFHRIIKDFVIQGGDFENKRGRGGYSIYNKGSFEDENFLVPHDRVGRLSMANSGPNTNGAQFFITTCVADFLTGVHVVLGQLIDGIEILDKIQSVDTDDHDMPITDVKISQIWIERYDRQTLGLEELEYMKEIADSHKSHTLFYIVAAMALSCIVVAGVKFKNEYYKRDLIENIRYSKFV